MAAEISVYHGVVVTVDGVQFADFGSLVVPIKGSAAEIEDGTGVILRQVRVPAGDSLIAWEWDDTAGFTFLAAKIKGGEGFVQVGLRYNAAVSDTDLTPTGSINQWNDTSLSCVGVYCHDTERAYIHATAATAVGDTAGFPTVWSSGSRVLAVADKLAFLNEDADNDVVIDLLIVPK